MKQKIITVALVISCLTFSIIAFIVKNDKDTISPAITVGNKKLIYTEGDDYDTLLKDVKANDNKDGDITSDIFVDRIINRENSKQATVIYAVIDKSKNVGTNKRVITYIGKRDTSIEIDESGTTALVSNDKFPVIHLMTTTTTVATGQSFEPLSIVEDVLDDKDTREQLFQNIHIEGIYDTTVSGTYVLQYHVTDQENHSSNIEIFTLIVQG
ncbi:MAG: hypothetical protein PHX08_14940 [Lachnospiraceae bacterium]|nr:hypothetical protein [Lachnospiraceae bacterium]